ncbi:MAG: LysM peptidoglycan-binding domain-containing protein [Lachnotalea sp.]
MDIYVVQPNDNIYSIAEKFGVSAQKIIIDNELSTPTNLVTGQALVITYPKQTHVVQPADTIDSIAATYNVSQMQILRNNPFLANYKLNPGETIIISYNTTGQITTNGFVYPYISLDTLKKTLPNLTYITIYNYRIIKEGEIISYFDDTDVIQISKDYDTIPLLMISTLSLQGEPDMDTAYSILSNDTYQYNTIANILNVVKTKGYAGINIVFNYIKINVKDNYQNFITKLENEILAKGYLLFVTINPHIKSDNNIIVFEEIDYSFISENVTNMSFIQFIWGINYGPPLPVNSIKNIHTFMHYVIATVSPDKVTIGKSLVSYDWALPYVPGKSTANALSINSALNLARDTGAVIQFDDVSQTPFFIYKLKTNATEVQHIVWTIDARSVSALIDLIAEFELNGCIFWNLMLYFPQLWLVINTQYEVEKIIQEKPTDISN